MFSSEIAMNMLPAALNATLPYGWPTKAPLLVMAKFAELETPFIFVYVTILWVAVDVMYMVPEESNVTPDGKLIRFTGISKEAKGLAAEITVGEAERQVKMHA